MIVRRAAWMFLVTCAACAACARAPRAAVSTTAPKVIDTPLIRLARELDPGPTERVWPTLEERVRIDIELKAPRVATDAERLSAARERLTKVTLTTDDVPALRAKLRGMLEALYLLEPLGFAREPGTREADVLLARFWASAGTFRVLASVDLSAKTADARDLAVDRDMLQRLATVALGQCRFFAARVLRGAAFDDGTRTTLELVAKAFQAEHDHGRARLLWAEVVAQRPGSLTAGDWLAVGRAALAAEDFTSADDALARARVAAKPAPGSASELDLIAHRRISARVAAAQRQRQRIEDLRHAAARTPDTGVDARLAHADLLREIDRPNDAHALYEALAKESPADARIRVRLSQRTFAAFSPGVSMLDAAERARQVLDVPHLEKKDGGYHSWAIGLMSTLGMQLIASAPKGADAAERLRERAPGLIRELRAANDSLRAFEPGRAAAIAFVLDRAASAFDAGTTVEGLLAEARSSSGAVSVLVDRHPGTGDLYRLLYGIAAQQEDFTNAFAMVTRPPAPIGPR